MYDDGNQGKYMGWLDVGTNEYIYPSAPQNISIAFTPDSPETPFYLSALDGDFSTDGITIISEIGSSEDTTIGNASAKVLNASMLNPYGTMESLEWGYGFVCSSVLRQETAAVDGGYGYAVEAYVSSVSGHFGIDPSGNACVGPTSYPLGGVPKAVIANEDGTDVLYITDTKIGRYVNGVFSEVTTPNASQTYLAKKYREAPVTVGIQLDEHGCPCWHNYKEIDVSRVYTNMPMGIFDFSDVDARGLAFTVEAYDKMVLFDSDATDWINSLDFTSPKTVSDLVDELMTEMGFTSSIDGSAVNTTFSYAENPLAGFSVTYRQVLKWLAEIMGCNARMGRTDVVEFFVFINGARTMFYPDVIISGSHTRARYRTPEVGEIVCYDTAGTPYSSGAIPQTDAIYYIVSNPLFRRLDQDTSILTSIQNLFYGGGSAWWGFRPTTISAALSYPGIDVGDMTVIMSADGSWDFIPVMRQTMHWNGVWKATITATGKQQRSMPDGEISSLAGSVGNSNPVAATQGYFGGVSVSSEADYPGESIDIFPDGITIDNGTYTKTIAADGPIGTSGSGTTDVPSGSYTTLGEIEFPRGSYLIAVNARFPQNSTGRRGVLLSTVQNSGSAPSEMYLDIRNAVVGTTTNCKFAAFRRFTNDTTTFYLNAYQNSGSTQSVSYQWIYARLA